MYKKRFAKWGFQKNTKRCTAVASTRTTQKQCWKVAKERSRDFRQLHLLPASLGFGTHETLIFMFMTNVRTYSTAYFESVQVSNRLMLTPRQQSNQMRLEVTEEVSFTFKLVIELLNRGQGELAGRMARKAFLLVEGILDLDGPVLVWNLIELLHQMVKLGHMQLFQMLLKHLIDLVHGKSRTHPLPAILHGLRDFVMSLLNVTLIPGISATTSPSSTPSQSSMADSEEFPTSTGASPLSQGIASLLEQAWTLNAEILFNSFDDRFFQLYFRLHWDSCSLRPPAAIVRAAKQWLSQIDQQQTSYTAMDVLDAKESFGVSSLEDNTSKQLLCSRKGASLPQDFEALRTSSIATLREYGGSFIDGSSETVDTDLLLRIFAGLFTEKIFEEWPSAVERLGPAGDLIKDVSRSHASNVACAMRTIMEINGEHLGDEFRRSSGAVELSRSIVALHEYAHSKTYPRVVRELWLLQNTLAAAGEYEEAQEVGKSAYRRIEEYMQDIPVYST
ncbi:hypothetical protein H2200_000331 [Cladophialophora chaetospira]|uniref:Clr5 domain-containing protein n=1 Tax=Cladophialophora chaetospira TaxID=386627 RepID=A0AA38XNB7_9EURO|nr:hypothetical protein H2200_000331 [Cladophialophora chaetospira]